MVRNPAAVLGRVSRGERFLVCRHRRPVATLQPITGWVVDGSGEHDCDIYGSPLGDQRREVEKLSQLHRELLLSTDGRSQRFIYGGQPGYREAIDDLTLRGLARRSQHRGMVLTGRGIVLKEWLQEG